ncbi:acyltransferase [Kriegella aquimaris]|uniref:Transferase hexapeptide (Six repeat-containing protein) n=1 Tax=Kriegella aquimaris TaxID=192904 RepID=A0A1G9U6E4_9FLAO|nr:acyltransferase [Kriegella aquimaris]SDM55432.1 transferase hexapeptide (six repeat-containing protein) [Kriegella aquimaris]
MLKKILNLINKYRQPPISYARSLGVSIGENCKIAIKNWGSEPYLITLGNHVHITTNVQFINHDGGVWVFRDEIPDFDVFGKIVIGDNSYIGNNAVIMPGVSIGKNCVIGANSVVTKSIPDNMVVAGVPAKYICTTEEYKVKMMKIIIPLKKKSGQQKKKFLIKMPSNAFIIKDALK